MIWHAPVPREALVDFRAHSEAPWENIGYCRETKETTYSRYSTPMYPADDPFGPGRQHLIGELVTLDLKFYWNIDKPMPWVLLWRDPGGPARIGIRLRVEDDNWIADNAQVIETHAPCSIQPCIRMKMALLPDEYGRTLRYENTKSKRHRFDARAVLRIGRKTLSLPWS